MTWPMALRRRRRATTSPPLPVSSRRRLERWRWPGSMGFSKCLVLIGREGVLPLQGAETVSGRFVVAIVVTHNSGGLIDECLDSLSLNMSDESGLSVVVVDKASSDDSAERARAHSVRPQVVVQEALGLAAALNAGIAGAGSQATHFLILTPDTRLAEDAVSRLADAVERPQIGIAVPRTVDGEGHPIRSLRREPTALRAFGEAVLGEVRAAKYPALGEVVMGRTVYEQPTRADWALGSPMLISAECHKAAGPWDERYQARSVQADYSLRARDLGYALQLVPEAAAIRLGVVSHAAVDSVRLQRRRKGFWKTVPFALGLSLSAARRAVAGRSTHESANGTPNRTSQEVPESGRLSDQGPDYVLFAGLDWWYHSRAHSDFQLLRRIAQTRDALVVNSIGMRMPTPGRTSGTARRIIRKIKSAARLMRKPVEGLPGFNVLTPFLLPMYGHPLGRKVNALLVAGQVRVASLFAGLNTPIVVATLPTAIDVVDRIPHRALVYNRSDKHSEFVEADQELIRELEKRMLRESDLIIYTSHDLMEEDRGLAGGRQMFLDHGVDLDHFDPQRQLPEPEDIKTIPRPRVGFFGGLADYVVDFELIRALANGLPQAQVVLVGDQKCSDEEIERMVALPNLTWLGFRPYEEIPAYGAAFDVAIMPWQDNEWIRRSNPIKLKEYLALGLPVVSTDFPELARYSDVVSIATSPADFVGKVASALEGGGPGTPASRRAAVAGDTWDQRTRELMTAIESLDAR